MKPVTKCGAIVVSPLIVLFITYLLVNGLTDWFVIYDIATTEIYINHLFNNQLLLVGPYSQYGLNHLGPWLFYLLAPFYWLSGKSSSGMFSGSLLLNIIVLIFLVKYSITNHSDEITMCVSLIFTGLLLYRLNSEMLFSPWNPWIIILPFMLLLFLCAGLDKNIETLPLIIAIGSFIIQSHYGTAITITSVILASLFLYIKRTGYNKDFLKWSIISLIVFVILWLPPIIDQLFYTRNMERVITTLLSNKGPHQTLYVTTIAFVERLIELPLRLYDDPLLSSNGTIVFGGIVCSIFIGSVILAIKKKMTYTSALGIIVIVASIASMWSISRIPGEMRGRYTVWIIPVGIALLIVVMDIMVRLLVKNASLVKHCTTVTFVILILISSWSFFIDPKNLFFIANEEESRIAQNSINKILENPEDTIILSNYCLDGNWTYDGILTTFFYKKEVPFKVRNLTNYPLKLPVSCELKD